MKNLKISTRLSMLIAIASVVMLIIGLYGLRGLDHTNAGLKTVYEDRTVALGYLGDIQALLLENRLALLSMVANQTPEELARGVADLEKNTASINKLWADYTATNSTADEEKLAKELGESRAKFLTEGMAPTVAALKAGNFDEAKKLSFEKVRPLYIPIRKDIALLSDIQVDEAKREFEAA